MSFQYLLQIGVAGECLAKSHQPTNGKGRAKRGNSKKSVKGQTVGVRRCNLTKVYFTPVEGHGGKYMHHMMMPL